MGTINDTYINALLADTSYVTLKENGIILTGSAYINAVAKRMTPDVAQYIADNFVVVTQENNDDGSGFDATVWQGKTGTNYAGQVYISMRGTQGALDIAEDADLATSGLAHEQLVDMVNWWLREATPAGQLARQMTLQETHIPGTLFDFEDFVPAPGVMATGNLANIDRIHSVNGHSLGGYMATAFARIFGQQWDIESINTFNSAGFSRLASENIENGFNQIAEVIGHARGLSDFNSSAHNNYFAENGINVTTNTWDPVGFKQYGERIPLFQEETAPLGLSNHYMYKLTDRFKIVV
ncbi:hypothetical protein AB835_11275 [Candidatus Endobugula sertula]|uniref:Fungal lipase-like domain-containing protein n=1 Tax=Candidatus Endobugula sertula TaxID=62101 RepID=A0A1D2QN26_9GAMM|nr:hypothetical protein AB835_11275 [Candidatus Endobugula sertula]